MKIWIATSGSYSDYSIDNVFLHEEDAKTYADTQYEGSYDEWDVHEGPVERRTKYYLMWWAHMPDRERVGIAEANPYTYDNIEDWSHIVPPVKHDWITNGVNGNEVLHIEGWDKQHVLKVYSEQRAQYLARKEGIT